MAGAAIVSVGRELLTGRVVDSNFARIARALGRHGVAVLGGCTVPDHVAEIARAVRRAWADGADLVVTGGGLGPSDDDRTAAGVALAWGCLMSVDEQALAAVRDHDRQHGLDSDAAPGAVKMATLPVAALPIANPVGAAPAIWRSEPPRATLSLPGVPGELQAILDGAAVQALLAPLRNGWFAELRMTLPVRDERRLVKAIATLGRAHRGVFLKPDPQAPDQPTMDVIAEVVDNTLERAEARARAALDALARTLAG